jgi:hypothetical protein
VREGWRRGAGSDHGVALIVPLISSLGGTYLLNMMYVIHFYNHDFQSPISLNSQ